MAVCSASNPVHNPFSLAVSNGDGLYVGFDAQKTDTGFSFILGPDSAVESSELW